MSEKLDELLQHLAESVSIVLVETSHSGNIGAVARAMKNMGFSKLVLVNACENLNEEAIARSSGAHDILENARRYDSLDEALENQHIVIGASARTRKITWPLINSRDCAELVVQSIGESTGRGASRVALMFGRESSGLTNEELQRCHYHVNIPANPEYASLNLAMAVQVLSYELRMQVIASDKDHEQVSSVMNPAHEDWDGELATVKEVEGFMWHLEQSLTKIGYLDPQNPRVLMTRLRRLFQRAHMDKMEVNIMRGILKAVLQKANS